MGFRGLVVEGRTMDAGSLSWNIEIELRWCMGLSGVDWLLIECMTGDAGSSLCNIELG
jgi:hypothetical protein